MDAAPDSRYREGLAGVLLGACFLLFAISAGVLVLATNATQPASLLGAARYILSFFVSLIGLGIAVDGFRRMTQRHR